MRTCVRCIYVCMYALACPSVMSEHFEESYSQLLFSEFVLYISVESESEHSSSKTRGPYHGPQNIKWRLSRKRLKIFY
jgi:hypothetical protein